MLSLSYIIPTYNNLHLLKRCINSIERQLDPSDRVIIIDDGSKDHTYEYLIEHYGNVSNFTILQQQNSGSGVARNLGLEMCKTDYLWFVDSDDIVEENASSIIKSTLVKDRDDVVFFNHYVQDTKTKKPMKLALNPEDFREIFLTAHFPWNKVIKTELFTGVEFPKKHIRYQDHATIPKVLAKAKTIGYINECLYTYDISHDGNISKKLNKNNDLYTACDYLVEHYRQGQFQREEIEIMLIKTFIFNKLYRQSKSLKEIHADFKRIRAYLNTNLPDWKRSNCLTSAFAKEYKHLINNLSFKIGVANLFKRSTFATSSFIWFYLRVKELVK